MTTTTAPEQSASHPPTGSPAYPLTADGAGSACLSFSRPEDPDFESLPISERDSIKLHLAILEQIHNSPNITAACRRIAAQHGWVGTQKGRDGFSPDRIHARYKLFRRTGDWRVLRNRRNVPDESRTTLPFAFRQFWISLRLRYQRDGGDAAAHRQLLRIWKTGISDLDLEIGGKTIKAGSEIPFIPGYEKTGAGPACPPADPFTGRPPGWSYDNLNRIRPDEYTTAVLRYGRAKAADFRPKVPTTRDGLKYAQLYYIDDQQHDILVNFLGISRRAMRPWQLDCLEALSASHVAYLFKPTVVDDDGTKRRLREQDTLWLVIHVLMTEGYRSDTGTIIAGEHGTATLRDTVARALENVTAGKVTFEAGGLQGAPAIAGFFEGAGGGNPRHKASLESIRNLLRNEMCALPGATGLDRDHCPETNVPDKGGADRYNTAILKAYEALPEAKREWLQQPFLNWHRFVELATHFIQAIDRRTEHDLKHWARCGFTTQLFRLPSHLAAGASQSQILDPQSSILNSDWLPMETFAQLPSELQAHLRQQFEHHPELMLTRKLSPYEVRQSLRRDSAIKKLKPSALPELLGLDRARKITVRKDVTIEICDQEISPEPLLYHACVDSSVGQSCRSASHSASGGTWLPRGTECLAFLDHITCDLYLFDARENRRGAYIGTVSPVEHASLASPEALARMSGKVAAIEKDMLAPAAKYGAELARRNLEMRQGNNNIIQSTDDRADMPRRTKNPTDAPTQRQWEKQQRDLAEEAEIARSLNRNT